ncbi:MAG: alkaline phosphatase [Flavobacteriales bacterium]|nr:alkaline phosphatase [Flavobacteriales bacterium]
MKKFSFVGAISIIVFFLASSCNSAKPQVQFAPKKPKRIILMIGDGMGLTQISTLFVERDNTNNFQRFMHIGFINTKSGTHKITDSAAGATAFSCGVKTYNNSVGMGMDTTAANNLVEIFSQHNYKTALVATSSITHATPGAFYAHTSHRSHEQDIANQLLKSDIDFFAGGGLKFFSKLQPQMKLYNWQIDSVPGVHFKPEVKYNHHKKYGYLKAADGMPTMETNRGNFLTDASNEALKYLNNSRFFMMIEGSQIDWGGHAKNYEYVKTEMFDFDAAVGAMLDFAEKDGNTLVIVTADHETGGLALVAQDYTDKNGNTKENYNAVQPKFITGGHTATLIPVMAYGPGAENFQGFYENNEIFYKIKNLMR